MDVPTATNDFEEFRSIDKSFYQTREFNLLQELLDAMKDQDPDMYQQKVNAYGM
jgi:hypothetical protein